jgi:hypothetical protein
MNTVGKKGKLGEHIRCVVSVSMLTEGWDANTVTHILGIRAFRSQLLCEQVVGRGLRRRRLRGERRRPVRARVRRGLRRAVRVHPDRPGAHRTRSPARPAVEVHACPSGRSAHHVPAAVRLPHRAAPEPLMADFGDDSGSTSTAPRSPPGCDRGRRRRVGESTASTSIRGPPASRSRTSSPSVVNSRRTTFTATTTSDPHPLPSARRDRQGVARSCVTFEPGCDLVDAAVRRVARGPPSGSELDRDRNARGPDPQPAVPILHRSTIRRHHRRRVVLHPQGRVRHHQVTGQPRHPRRPRATPGKRRSPCLLEKHPRWSRT